MCGIWSLLAKGAICRDDYGKLYTAFMKIQNRGPDSSSFDLVAPNLLLGFHRLAIMDLSADGNQPFHHVRPDGSCVYCICNGEIYNYENLKQEYGIKTNSHSDCEIIIPLYEKLGVDKMIQLLGSEFAFIIADISKNGKIKLVAGRDPLGVRPLFYGLGKGGGAVCFSSEAKGLCDLYDQVHVFPPGSYMICSDGEIIHQQIYYNFSYKQLACVPPLEDIYAEIRKRFFNCVRKRLMTDRPFGALLSGGLDSSLVCGAIKYLEPNLKFPVFTIALKSGSTDLPYAKEVANFLGLEHHVIEIDEEDAASAVDDTVRAIESYDITTVRASVVNRLVCKYVQENTNIRVLMSGETSDENWQGYLMFHNAPSHDEGRQEAIKLVKNIHRFDGLRFDRCMGFHGIEGRVPFADPEIIDYVFSLPSELTAPQNGLEKALLRHAFKDLTIIPESILMRVKAAFSDSVTKKERSLYQIIQEHIDLIVSDEEFATNKNKFIHCTPFTKESYYYRKKFVEYFGESEEKAKLIPYFWMPAWSPETNDPSARTLKIYRE